MGNKKKILFFLLPLLLLLLFGGCQNKNTIEILDAKADASNAVVFAIHGKGGEPILDSVFIKYKENMSVADISREVCREKKIPISFSGVGNMVYVQGINNLFELDNGPESGWLYAVNGVFQSVGCGDCIVGERDCIEWFYTLDMGKDVGGDSMGVTG